MSHLKTTILLIFLLWSSVATSLVLVDSIEHSAFERVDKEWFSSLGINVWIDYAPENKAKEHVRLVFQGDAPDQFYDSLSVLLIVSFGENLIARINSVDPYRFSITLHEGVSISLYIKLDRPFQGIEPGRYVFYFGGE